MNREIKKPLKSKVDFIAAVQEAENEDEVNYIVCRELRDMLQKMTPDEIASWMTTFIATVENSPHYHIEFDIPFSFLN